MNKTSKRKKTALISVLVVSFWLYWWFRFVISGFTVCLGSLLVFDHVTTSKKKILKNSFLLLNCSYQLFLRDTAYDSINLCNNLYEGVSIVNVSSYMTMNYTQLKNYHNFNGCYVSLINSLISCLLENFIFI